MAHLVAAGAPRPAARAAQSVDPRRAQHSPAIRLSRVHHRPAARPSPPGGAARISTLRSLPPAPREIPGRGRCGLRRRGELRRYAGRDVQWQSGALLRVHRARPGVFFVSRAKRAAHYGRASGYLGSACPEPRRPAAGCLGAPRRRRNQEGALTRRRRRGRGSRARHPPRGAPRRDRAQRGGANTRAISPAQVGRRWL